MTRYRSSQAGWRIAQREIRREGVHMDLRPSQLPATVAHARRVIAKAEQALALSLRVLDGRGWPVTVCWYEQIRVPADVWMADWKPWEPIAALHPDAVSLRCCAWLDLDAPE